MAIRNFCGFETGDTREASSINGVASIQSSVVRTGSYALRVNPTGSGTGALTFGGVGESGSQNLEFWAKEIYYCVHVYIATLPSTGSELLIRLNESNSAHADVRIDSAGVLHAYTGTTLRASGTTSLQTGQWYRIEGKFSISSGYEIRLNGATEIAAAGAYHSPSAWFHYLRLGKHEDYNGNSVDYYFDDVAIRDDEWVGAGRVRLLRPTGDGTYTEWTGSYADVDELPPDGNASYIEASGASGQVQTVTLESTGDVGVVGEIAAVKALAYVWADSFNESLFVRLRSGATDVDTDTSFIFDLEVRALLARVDPATSSAWTHEAVDALEVGVGTGSDAQFRCTALYLTLWENDLPVVEGEGGTEFAVGVSGAGQKQGFGSGAEGVAFGVNGAGVAAKRGAGLAGVAFTATGTGVRATILTPQDRQAALLDDPLVAPDGTIAGRERGWLLGQYYGAEEGVLVRQLPLVVVEIDTLLAAVFGTGTAQRTLPVVEVQAETLLPKALPSGAVSRTPSPVEIEIEALLPWAQLGAKNVHLPVITVELDALLPFLLPSGAVSRTPQPVVVEIESLIGALAVSGAANISLPVVEVQVEALMGKVRIPLSASGFRPRPGAARFVIRESASGRVFSITQAAGRWGKLPPGTGR